MHLHLPKPLHGWRAFIGEVGVIVLGILIALTAEELVGAWQWHDKLQRAETSMRLELAEDDGPQAYARVLIASCLDQEIGRIHDRAGIVPAQQLRQLALAYWPPLRSWDSEAWKVVVASDIGSHMGPDRLVAWSSPYRSMPRLTDANEREAQLVIDLREALPPSGEPSSTDLQTLRRTAAQLRVLNRRFLSLSELLLARIGAIGAQVPLVLQHELAARARAMYGGCVAVPNLNAAPRAQSLIADLQSATLNPQ